MKPAYAEANSGKPEPVLRAVVKRADKWFETAVFWPSTHPESRYAMTGYIELGLGNARVPVCAFINERKRSDSQAGGPFISLSTRTTDLSTGEIGYAQVALGNVVNTRSDGGEVFYDTVIFNPVDADGKNIPHSTPITVWVTDACDAALHRALGFTHARLPRPKERPRTTVQLHQTKCAHPRLNLQPYKRRHVNRIAARFLAGGTTAQRGCRACALCANDTSEAFYG